MTYLTLIKRRYPSNNHTNAPVSIERLPEISAEMREGVADFTAPWRPQGEF